MKFQFATSARIIFGAGASTRLAEEVSTLGSKVLLVTGAHADRFRSTIETFSSGVAVTTAQVDGEPTIESVQSIVEIARSAEVDLVVGLGGGSVIDAAKAVAGLTGIEGPIERYLEVVGEGKPLERPALPVVAIPTTAGTGSEVTKNAVITSTPNQQKVSLRHHSMTPRIAVIDPLLTHSVPAGVTASTGLDALSQCIEPFVSPLGNFLTDAIALAGIESAAMSLEAAYLDPDDARAREGMALASMCGGLALANAKLGAVHGFAGPLGGQFAAPHGAVCGRLLPSVFAVNAQALEQRGERAMGEKYLRVSQALTGDPVATVGQGVRWLERLVDVLGVPGLGAYGVELSHVDEVVAKAAGSSSMKGNSLPLTTDELSAALRMAL